MNTILKQPQERLFGNESTAVLRFYSGVYIFPKIIFLVVPNSYSFLNDIFPPW